MLGDNHNNNWPKSFNYIHQAQCFQAYCNVTQNSMTQQYRIKSRVCWIGF